jgi:hypothetical protein
MTLALAAVAACSATSGEEATAAEPLGTAAQADSIMRSDPPLWMLISPIHVTQDRDADVEVEITCNSTDLGGQDCAPLLGAVHLTYAGLPPGVTVTSITPPSTFRSGPLSGGAWHVTMHASPDAPLISVLGPPYTHVGFTATSGSLSPYFATTVEVDACTPTVTCDSTGGACGQRMTNDCGHVEVCTACPDGELCKAGRCAILAPPRCGGKLGACN